MKQRSLKMETEFSRHPLFERFALFVIVFVFWLILAWPVGEDGSVLLIDVLMGLVVAAIVALVMRAMFRQNFVRLLNPRCWFWMIVYFFVFSWYVLKGGMDVVYRVLHPTMPIHPGIVRVKSNLQTDTGRIVLANSITLTPGTLTVDVVDDRIMVHWIDCPPRGTVEDRTRAIADSFERLLRGFVK